jgi:type IV pilus assembly protein PilW
MHSLKHDIKGTPGFTLIELLIAMLISALIMAAILTTYKFNRDVYEAQDQVTEVQQTLRAATYQLVREIRMAGFNPLETVDEDHKPKIVEAENDLLYFTYDSNEDGEVNVGGDDTGEHVVYDLYTSATGIPTLGRTTDNNDIDTSTPLAHQPVADNIEAIEFYYTLKDGTNVLPTAAAPLTAAQIADIRSIQVSILARTRYPDRKYTDGQTYLPASNADEGTVWGPYNDNYRRRLLITSVTCRNLGL